MIIFVQSNKPVKPLNYEPSNYFIPAILLGIVFILETLGMPDKWACLCGILVLPVTIIITAIIDHKTHYFTNKQREINKARARAKELHEEWIRDNQDFIRKENKRIDREVDEMGTYKEGGYVNKSPAGGFPSGGF